VESPLERQRIAPQRALGDSDLVGAAIRDDRLAEVAPEIVERISQRVSRRRLSLLGPEHREQHIAPMKSPRSDQREIGKQREALRLAEHATNLPTLVPPKVDPAECSETDDLVAQLAHYSCFSKRKSTGDAPVTAGGRRGDARI